MTEEADAYVAELSIGMWGNEATDERARNASAWITRIFEVDEHRSRHAVEGVEGACKPLLWDVRVTNLGTSFDCENDNEADKPACLRVHREVGETYRTSWKVFSGPSPEADTMWSNFREGSLPAHGAFSNWEVEKNCSPSWMPCEPWNGNAWAHEAGHLMSLDHDDDGEDLPDTYEAANIMSRSPNRRAYVTTDDAITILEANTGEGWSACDLEDTIPTDSCEAAARCGECVGTALCGWCDGSCVEGTSEGPSAGACDDWTWTPPC